MDTGRGEFAQVMQDVPQPYMGAHEASRVVLALRQEECLLIELQCRPELSPVHIKACQSPQHRIELWGVSHLVAQLPGTGEGSLNARSRMTPSDPQRLTQRELHVQLALGTRGSVRERCEHLQPCHEVLDGFDIRRALEGIL